MFHSPDTLYLFDNTLTGTTPSEIGTMTALSKFHSTDYLNLRSNRLTKTIPSEIGTMTALSKSI